jgi:polyhydroxyalkanoate synthesis regulator phasin
VSRLEQLLVGTLVLVGLLVLAALGGHHVGAAGVQAAWESDKLARATAQEKAVLAAVTQNELARQKDLAAARTTIATYERKLHESDDRIAAERAAADHQRLRITVPQRDCAAPAGDAAGAGRADAAGTEETVELPEAVERGLRDLAEDADREVARLGAKVDALQEWIRTHGFFGEVP